MMVTVEDEKLRPVRMAGNPVKIDNSATQYQPAPALGQHTREVLRSRLGED
jgi:crotonobetainyl-CoA:carnitine CoA-transferase CaiB-like acyl-CoA transferase